MLIVRLSVFNQNEESSDEDEEVIGNQGIRVSFLICKLSMP